MQLQIVFTVQHSVSQIIKYFSLSLLAIRLNVHVFLLLIVVMKYDKRNEQIINVIQCFLNMFIFKEAMCCQLQKYQFNLRLLLVAS